jgi:hypothetical protein
MVPMAWREGWEPNACLKTPALGAAIRADSMTLIAGDDGLSTYGQRAARVRERTAGVKLPVDATATCQGVGVPGWQSLGVIWYVLELPWSGVRADYY